MADVKISELTALASASVDASGDVLAVVDTSATATRKITVENLLSPITINKATDVITDLGEVTTADINGGTWQGTIDGNWTAASQTCANLGTVSAATSITSTAFVGNITGNVTGTVLTAAQTNITSVGTLTALTGGTGDLVWDTTTLVVDSSADRVGIGTASAQTTLEVQGHFRIDPDSGSAMIDMYTGGTRRHEIIADTSGNLEIRPQGSGTNRTKWDSSGNVTIASGGDTNMYISDAVVDMYSPVAMNGNRLAVGGGTESASTPSLTFQTGSDYDTGMYRKDANVIGFATNGTERVSISDALNVSGAMTVSGKAGFGGASATGTGVVSIQGDENYLLHVDQTDDNIHVAAFRGAGDTGLDIQCDDAGGSTRINSVGATDSLILEVSDGEDAITINHTREVGIFGVPEAGYKLKVTGHAKISDSLTLGGNITVPGLAVTTNDMSLNSDTHANFQIDRGSTSYHSGVLFYTAGALKWRITQQGADDILKILGNSDAEVVSLDRNEIAFKTTDSTVAVYPNPDIVSYGSGGWSSYYRHDLLASSWWMNTTIRDWRFYTDQSSRSQGVKLSNGSTSWSSIASDERLKDNWTMFDDALGKINTLTKIGTYNAIDPETKEVQYDGLEIVGLSAQEVQKVLPTAVTKHEDEEYWGLNYQDVFVLMVKAVQELSAKVTALENA